MTIVAFRRSVALAVVAACAVAGAVAQEASSVPPTAPGARAPLDGPTARPPSEGSALRPPLDGPTARPPSEGAALRPPSDGPLGRARPPARPLDDAKADATVSGRVARWLPNPNGDVDGMLLDDGTQVAFPPHLSAALLQAVKLRDSVRVRGWRGDDPHFVRAAEIRSARSGRSVADEGPSPDARPAPRSASALQPMTAGGRVQSLLHTDRGDVAGVLLDDGSSVRFPPHVGARFADLLKTGSTLYARGYGTHTAYGNAIEATAIGADADAARRVYAGPPTRGPADPHARPPAGDDAPPPPAPRDRAS